MLQRSLSAPCLRTHRTPPKRDIETYTEGARICFGKETYTLGKCLAKGRFSTLYHTRATTALATPKVLKITALPETHTHLHRHLRREVRNHTALSLVSTTVVPLHHAEYLPAQRTALLLMENPGGGDLLTYLETLPGQRITNPQHLAQAFLQLVQAVEKMHALGIMHRDIKPENILVSEDRLQFYLADFGYSTTYTETSRPSTPCGDPRYAAPEVTLSKEGYDLKADIWSLGVVLWRMATISLPFGDHSKEGCLPQEVLRNVQTQHRRAFPPFFSKELKDLLEQLLNPCPSERPSFDAIKSHPFFRAK
jgi:protein-serine/threonine kinase